MMNLFGDRLRERMAVKNFTAKDLGRHAGVEYRTVEGWTSSRRSLPRADTAVAIARALDTTVEYLVTGEVSPSLSHADLGLLDRARQYRPVIEDLDELKEDIRVPLIAAIHGAAEEARKSLTRGSQETRSAS